jgi:hypothetical protein
MNVWLFLFLFLLLLLLIFLLLFLPLCSQFLDLASLVFCISGHLDGLRRLHVGTCCLIEIVPVTPQIPG